MNNQTIQKIKFGGTTFEMDDLADKVLTGEKVATSSLLEYYLSGKKKRSKTGDLFSVLNSTGKEVAVIKIEKIQIVKFGDITEEFAKEEGDGNLENWKSIHEPYYARLLSLTGKELDAETLLVCEWFKVIQL